MEDLYIYTAQVNIALLVYYLLFRLLFANDTFLAVRRLFLCSVLFLSFVYPLSSFLINWGQQDALQGVMVNYAEFLTIAASAVTPVQETSVYTWQNLFLFVWGAGVGVLFAKMFFQLWMVCRMASRGKKVVRNGACLIALEPWIAPFSFFGWIFVNPAYYEDKDLAEIITHERTHVSQWHSADILLGEILCILFWFNPVVWLFRREIRQNLEFLADKQVVNSGYNRKNYQYHLLRLSQQLSAVPVVNNFNVSPLKKRIIMMNKKQTSRIALIRYMLLVPVTGLLLLSAGKETVAEVTEKAVSGFKPAVQEMVAEVAKKTETGFKPVVREVKTPSIAGDDERLAALKGKVVSVKKIPVQAIGNPISADLYPVPNKVSSSGPKAVTSNDVKKMGIDGKGDILYVVDGKKMPVDFGPGSLSPDDIESLTVLKEDGVASRLHGEGRKVGVIIITTKKP